MISRERYLHFFQGCVKVLIRIALGVQGEEAFEFKC